MVVHGFYHLMGYDHIQEEDKKKMRPKEEKVLNKLQIQREEKESSQWEEKTRKKQMKLKY